MKETYEAPQVEIIEANVEKGFATTNGDGNPNVNAGEWGLEDE